MESIMLTLTIAVLSLPPTAALVFFFWRACRSGHNETKFAGVGLNRQAQEPVKTPLVRGAPDQERPVLVQRSDSVRKYNPIATGGRLRRHVSNSVRAVPGRMGSPVSS